jgi:hypothetical protein
MVAVVRQIGGVIGYWILIIIRFIAKIVGEMDECGPIPAAAIKPRVISRWVV